MTCAPKEKAGGSHRRRLAHQRLERYEARRPKEKARSKLTVIVDAMVPAPKSEGRLSPTNVFFKRS
jgi:hypothetical protein